MATEVRPLPRARGEFASQLPLVERGEHRAVGVDAFVSLDEFGIQRRRQADRASEDVRTVLIADAQGLAQAAGRDQQRRIALAREQRVRRDGGAQTHAQHRAAALRSCAASIDSMPRTAGSPECSGSRDRTLSACSSPSGLTPTTSVKVPPRSMAKFQPRGSAPGLMQSLSHAGTRAATNRLVIRRRDA